MGAARQIRMNMTDTSTTESARSIAPARLVAARVLSAIVGVAAIGALGYWAWAAASTPPRPSPASASTAEIFDFLAHSRGFAALPPAEQERFFDEVKAHYREEGPHRELKRGLDACSGEKISAIREALEPLAFRRVVDQARAFHELPRDARHAFLKEFREQAEAEAQWLRGYGDPERDLTIRLGAGLPNNPQEWFKYINTRTTPQERQWLEGFVSEVKAFDAMQRRLGSP